MGEVVIEKFVIDDYDFIYSLWMNSKNMGFNNVDDSREGIEKLLNKNPNTCFVARIDDEIVGTILAGNDGRRGYVYHLLVCEEHRKKGIGKTLIDAMLEGMREEGISKVALVVFAYNDTANAFYDKIGFIKRDDLYYRNVALKELVRIDT